MYILLYIQVWTHVVMYHYNQNHEWKPEEIIGCECNTVYLIETIYNLVMNTALIKPKIMY